MTIAALIAVALIGALVGFQVALALGAPLGAAASVLTSASDLTALRRFVDSVRVPSRA